MLRRLSTFAGLALLVGCSSSPSEEPVVADTEVLDDTAIAVDTTERDTFTEDTAIESDSDTVDSNVDDSTTADREMGDSVTVDSAIEETSPLDTAMADTSVPDTWTPPPDTWTPPPDTWTPPPDTWTPPPDTWTPPPDTWTPPPDTAVIDTGVVAHCSTPPSTSTKWYSTLSTARFYNVGASGSIRSCLVEYKPAYELWSDGLVKRRWIYLPPGAKIETGPNPVTGAAPNMDRWIFPVGTRFFKEFARATDGKKVETRIWERTATGYRFGTFKWRVDQTDADYTESGGPAALLLDDNKTTHELPTRAECIKCHDGEPGQGLGFSAVQLSKTPSSPSDPTLLSIAARGWLSHVPTSWPNPTLGSPIPGTTVEARGMGVVHANCGHCHNPLGALASRDMVLRTPYGATNAKTSIVYTTTVGQTSKWSGAPLLIDPGTAALGDGQTTTSAVYLRYSLRGTSGQMPPLGTALVDTNGLTRLAAFIRGL